MAGKAMFSQYGANRPQYDGITIPSESKVDVTGYVPAHIRIEELIHAGRRLEQARKERYDVAEASLDEPLAMVRTRGADLSEVMAEAHSLQAKAVQNAKDKAKEAQAEYEAELIAKYEAEKASESPVEPSDGDIDTSVSA